MIPAPMVSGQWADLLKLWRNLHFFGALLGTTLIIVPILARDDN